MVIDFSFINVYPLCSGNKKDTVLIVYHTAISEFLKNFSLTL